MFSMPEPGVYMLQMGGSISGANVVAKMVNDDVEAEVVTLEGSKDTVFRCRSTIFTVEDDDHEAERLLVEGCFCQHDNLICTHPRPDLLTFVAKSHINQQDATYLYHWFSMHSLL